MEFAFFRGGSVDAGLMWHHQSMRDRRGIDVGSMCMEDVKGNKIEGGTRKFPGGDNFFSF